MNLSNDLIAPNRETIRDYLLFVLFTGLRRREAYRYKKIADFITRQFVIQASADGISLQRQGQSLTSVTLHITLS